MYMYKAMLFYFVEQTIDYLHGAEGNFHVDKCGKMTTIRIRITITITLRIRIRIRIRSHNHNNNNLIVSEK